MVNNRNSAAYQGIQMVINKITEIQPVTEIQPARISCVLVANQN